MILRTTRSTRSYTLVPYTTLFRSDQRRVEVPHGDVELAVGAGLSLAHLFVHPTADDIAGRALAARIVLVHEPLMVAVQEIAAGAAQPFLDDRAGDPRLRPGDQPGRRSEEHTSELQSLMRT